MPVYGERSFNTESSDYIVGKIVDTNDPEKRGRVKIRRLDQDEGNISDEQLPWSYVQNQGYSQHGGVGRMTHQYVQGQWVSVRSSTADGQTQMVVGPINSDRENEEEKHFVPPHAKGKRYSLKKTNPGDGTLNTEPVKVEWDKENDPRKFMLDKANGQALFKSLKSMAPFPDGGQGSSASGGSGLTGKGGGDVIGFIKKYDPQNSSGAIKPALDIMKKILGNTNPRMALNGMIGADNVAAMNSFIQSQLQAQQQQPQDEEKEGDPCTRNGKDGHLKKINNDLVCVIDNPAEGDPCTLSTGKDGTYKLVAGSLRCIIT